MVKNDNNTSTQFSVLNCFFQSEVEPRAYVNASYIKAPVVRLQEQGFIGLHSGTRSNAHHCGWVPHHGLWAEKSPNCHTLPVRSICLLYEKNINPLFTPYFDLNRLNERGISACAQYWPSSGSRVFKPDHHEVRVTLVYERDDPVSTSRVLSILPRGETKVSLILKKNTFPHFYLNAPEGRTFAFSGLSE